MTALLLGTALLNAEQALVKCTFSEFTFSIQHNETPLPGDGEPLFGAFPPDSLTAKLDYSVEPLRCLNSLVYLGILKNRRNLGTVRSATNLASVFVESVYSPWSLLPMANAASWVTRSQ